VLDGRGWDASLSERLAVPLGLAMTVTLPEEAIMHRAAIGHRARPRDGEAVPAWMLPRSLGPAGLITAAAGDVASFARMHLRGGMGPDGNRLLGADSVAEMARPQHAMPGGGLAPDAVGLSWRLHEWGGRTVFGHDGSTAGQNAFLRADPQTGVVACLLTNAANGQPLYQRLFAEILDEYCGITMPAGPSPARGVVDVDLDVHAGRYERTSRRLEIAVRDGRLHALVTTTGQLADVLEAEPEELELLPADDGGSNFVWRSEEDEPWDAVTFGQLASGHPYVFAGGRITLRTG